MSSHHFVREGQEPSLLIDTVDIRRFEFFDQLAGWNPVIISTEISMPSLLLNNMQVDHLILETSDTSAWEGLKEHLPHLQIHVGQLPAVLSVLLNRFDCSAVQWLTDSEDIELWKSVESVLPVTIFNRGIKWIPASGGIFRAWLARGTEVRIYGENILLDGHSSGYEVVIDADGIHTIAGSGLWIGLSL